MEWINNGLLDLIFNVLLHNNGNTSHSIAPLKIVKYLLRENTEGCKQFVKRYIAAFDSNYEWSCIDIYTSLCVLMSLPKFREVSVKKKKNQLQNVMNFLINFFFFLTSHFFKILVLLD